MCIFGILIWNSRKCMKRKQSLSLIHISDGIEMDTFVHQQSPDIAKAVSVSKEFRDNIGAKIRDRSRGAGDQGVMVGYACDETPQLMPMPTVLAHRITRELSACRRSGYIKDIFSDGKAQVTVEYEDGKPVRLESVCLLYTSLKKNQRTEGVR